MSAEILFLRTFFVVNYKLFIASFMPAMLLRETGKHSSLWRTKSCIVPAFETIFST